MEEEIWKDVPGYEGRYMVSSYGRVMSLNYMHTGSARIMVQTIGTDGYCQLLLFKDGKAKFWQVHRLVATVFIPNPYNKKCVDHINGIKTDNRVDNLRWCTYKENVNNPVTRPKMGVCNKQCVIQMTLDGEYVREWDSVTNAAIGIGAKVGPISACCRGASKYSYGYKWRYKYPEKVRKVKKK